MTRTSVFNEILLKNPANMGMILENKLSEAVMNKFLAMLE